jgi:hypothetical protein
MHSRAHRLVDSSLVAALVTFGCRARVAMALLAGPAASRRLDRGIRSCRNTNPTEPAITGGATWRWWSGKTSRAAMIGRDLVDAPNLVVRIDDF